MVSIYKYTYDDRMRWGTPACTCTYLHKLHTFIYSSTVYFSVVCPHVRMMWWTELLPLVTFAVGTHLFTSCCSYASYVTVTWAGYCSLHCCLQRSFQLYSMKAMRRSVWTTCLKWAKPLLPLLSSLTQRALCCLWHENAWNTTWRWSGVCSSIDQYMLVHYFTMLCVPGKGWTVLGCIYTVLIPS